MDNASRCIQTDGGLVPLRKSTTGNFDASLDFTYVVQEFDRIHTINVPHADMISAWMADLATWGKVHPRLCIMERITPSFQFFFNAKLPPGTDATNLVPRIRGVIREFGFDARTCALLQDTQEPASNRYIWPDTCVTANRAYILRERIIAELASHDTAAQTTAYRWEDAIGGKMYEACLPGPPLPGSLKFVTCSKCNNKPAVRRECAQCMLRGVTISPGVMVPFALLGFDDAGAMSAKPIPPEIDLSIYMIHTNSPISNTWHVPSGTPFCIYAANTPTPAGAARRITKKEPENVAEHIRNLLQSVIRSTNAVFSQLVVTNRSVNHASPQKYVIHPRGIGSHSCIKFRNEHTDSVVYFVITPRGIKQRCYSNQSLVCGTNCKHREAQCMPLDEGVVRHLFPSMAADTTPNISNSTQTSAYQLATRISDYHANIIRGGAGRKRNVYGDSKRAPAPPPPSREGKRQRNSQEEET